MIEISPSNLERRAACPASGRLEHGIADKSGPDAERGTRLHEIMARIDRKSVVRERV